jgi:hypothetical protein
MSDNKALWNRVGKTDPAAVKPITGKQYQGNSPKPYWLIERATQEFGPVGIGWGVTVKSERFERLGEFDVLHVAVVSVWYVLDGKRSETFDQMGGTKAAYKTAKGTLMVDEDAGKKSVTDGMVKCLSMIGFAGDIFSGRWDDSKYVAELKREFADAEKEAERATKEALGKVSVSPTANAGLGIDEKRKGELEELALDMIEAHRNGKDLDAIGAYYFLNDNDDKLYVWHCLKAESKLRASIKANNPHAKKETAKA